MGTKERSAEAKRSINAGTLRSQVYNCIWESKTGRTDDELEDLLGLRHQTASARRRELVQLGAVVDSGVSRPTRSGRKATVWIVGERDGGWARHLVQIEALGLKPDATKLVKTAEVPVPVDACTATDILVVDGKNVLYWAYHAAKKSAESPRTKFQLYLANLRDTYEARTIVAWDADGATWRHVEFPDYKGHRPDIDPLLDQLNNEIKVIVGEVDGVEFIEAPGYEADDIIGTLARQAVEARKYLTIVTTDKDIMQAVVDPYVDILDRELNVTRAAEVVEKWGVPPKLIPDMLALLGDASDNLPGVPGIGKKTAPKLLNAYGSLDGVIAAAQAGTITGKRRERILDAAPLARKVKRLATLTTSVPAVSLLPPPVDDELAVPQPPPRGSSSTERGPSYTPATEELSMARKFGWLWSQPDGRYERQDRWGYMARDGDCWYHVHRCEPDKRHPATDDPGGSLNRWSDIHARMEATYGELPDEWSERWEPSPHPIEESEPEPAPQLPDVPGDNPSRGYGMVMAMWAKHALTGRPQVLLWEVDLKTDLNEPNLIDERGYGEHGQMRGLTNRIQSALAWHQFEPKPVKATIHIGVGAHWSDHDMNEYAIGRVTTGWRVNIAHFANRQPPVGRWRIVAEGEGLQPHMDLAFFFGGIPF